MPARTRRAHRADSRRYPAAVHVPDASVVWMSACLLRRAFALRGTLARSLLPCSPRPRRLRGSRTELLSCPRLRCPLNRQPSPAKERFRLLPGAATHSTQGGGLPWRCALAARLAWDRCSRADCLPASGQRFHAPCVPSRQLCTVCQHPGARLRGTPRPRSGARTPAGPGHRWFLPCRAPALFQGSRDGPAQPTSRRHDRAPRSRPASLEALAPASGIAHVGVPVRRRGPPDARTVRPTGGAAVRLLQATEVPCGREYGGPRSGPPRLRRFLVRGDGL